MLLSLNSCLKCVHTRTLSRATSCLLLKNDGKRHQEQFHQRPSLTGYMKKSARQPRERRRDGMPQVHENQDIQLVYDCHLRTYLPYVQASTGLGSMAYVITNVMAVAKHFTGTLGTSAGFLDNLTVNVLLMFDLYAGSVLVAMFLVLQRCPVRIYFDSSNSKFYAMFLDPLIVQKTKKKVIEQSSAVPVHHRPSSVLPWRNMTYEIDGSGKVCLFPSDFRTPNYLHKLLK